MRRIRNGMIGLDTLASSTKKLTANATDAPRKPSVCADSHPNSVAVEMA